MAALWTAFDLTTLSTNIDAALVIGVGVTLSYTAYRFIKRTANKV